MSAYISAVMYFNVWSVKTSPSVDKFDYSTVCAVVVDFIHVCLYLGSTDMAFSGLILTPRKQGDRKTIVGSDVHLWWEWNSLPVMKINCSQVQFLGSLLESFHFLLLYTYSPQHLLYTFRFLSVYCRPAARGHQVAQKDHMSSPQACSKNEN